MKTERSDVEFPVWRKKVDTALLKLGCTPLPQWVMKVWNIENLFASSISKKAKDASVSIQFKKKKYLGAVTRSTRRNSSLYRLFINKELQEDLKQHYVMSYLRTLESELRKNKKYSHDVEYDIPFWEFLDIEFNTVEKQFIFTAYYVQKPFFPEVFKSLVSSSLIKQLEKDNPFEFTKSDWKPRSELLNLLDVNNVIYFLIDTKNKSFYIGEAEKMIVRFKQGHLGMKNWDYFRFDILPESYSKKQRVSLERMLIRCFASIMINFRDIPSIPISEYRLSNVKIDQ